MSQAKSSVVWRIRVEGDYVCDVISVFKINYTIAYQGISVLQDATLKVKAKIENQNSSLDWVESNTSWTVKVKSLHIDLCKRRTITICCKPKYSCRATKLLT